MLLETSPPSPESRPRLSAAIRVCIVIAAAGTLLGAVPDHIKLNFGPVGGATAGSHAGNPVPLSPPPSPTPNLVSVVSQDRARLLNEALPFSSTPIEAAAPLLLSAADNAGLARSSLECLTAAVYYEAAGEPIQGQRAVAQVVLNRVRHPSFPNSVCGVVYQGSERQTGCQFTFTCDGSLRRTPQKDLWLRARQVAESALRGRIEASVGMSTHYHTDWVFPYWAPNLRKITKLGTHIFYGWNGSWGRRAAFTEAVVADLLVGTEAMPDPIEEPQAPLNLNIDPANLPAGPRLIADGVDTPPAAGPGALRQSASRLLADERVGALHIDQRPPRAGTLADQSALSRRAGADPVDRR